MGSYLQRYKVETEIKVDSDEKAAD